MFSKISTIAALSTFVACSTPFDSSDIDAPKIPSADTVMNGDIESMDLSIDDQPSLSHANVSGPVFEIIQTDMTFDDGDLGVATPVITEAPGRVATPLDPEETGDLAALLVNRVDGFLNIRMYPARDAEAKVCLQRPAGELCFKGRARAFDNDHGGEMSIELGRHETARSFTVEVSGSEYIEMGPFAMPGEDNLWKEITSCDTRLEIDSFQYDITDAGENNVAYVRYHSVEPASALICGIDEAGDGACAWEPIGTGKKELKIRMDSAEEASDVILRDEQGCSVVFGPTH